MSTTDTENVHTPPNKGGFIEKNKINDNDVYLVQVRALISIQGINIFAKL